MKIIKNRKTNVLIVLSAFVLIAAVIVCVLNSEPVELQFISQKLRDRYFVEFEYVKKENAKEDSRNPDAKLYYFKTKDQNEILFYVEYYWAPISFPLGGYIPFTITRETTDHFLEGIETFVIQNDPDVPLDVTNMYSDQAADKILDIISRVDLQKKAYKLNVMSSGITVDIRFKGKLYKTDFSCNKYSIADTITNIQSRNGN